MSKNNASFASFDSGKSGLIFSDVNHKEYPLNYYNVIDGKGLTINDECSYFFFVYSGVMMYSKYHEGKPWQSWNWISEGEFMSSRAGYIAFLLPEEEFKAIAIEVHNDLGDYKKSGFNACNLRGGPIEETGRLKYIDGCTDSLLIPPVKKGDPCLNHLHFPSGINQTQHTHPSHRLGLVVKGSGKCLTPFGELPLEKGTLFVIKEWDGVSVDKGLDGQFHPEGQHAFQTFDETMDVIAFHPDSDFGPEDEFHPMINRTIVSGVSANTIKEIQTQ